MYKFAECVHFLRGGMTRQDKQINLLALLYALYYSQYLFEKKNGQFTNLIVYSFFALLYKMVFLLQLYAVIFNAASITSVRRHLHNAWKGT